MKILRNQKLSTKPMTALKLTVTDPVTLQEVYVVEIEKQEAQDAIDYLRKHNGSAPDTVHALIDAMEVSVNLRVPAGV